MDAGQERIGRKHPGQVTTNAVDLRFGSLRRNAVISFQRLAGPLGWFKQVVGELRFEVQVVAGDCFDSLLDACLLGDGDVSDEIAS